MTVSSVKTHFTVYYFNIVLFYIDIANMYFQE